MKPLEADAKSEVLRWRQRAKMAVQLGLALIFALQLGAAQGELYCTARVDNCNLAVRFFGSHI